MVKEFISAFQISKMIIFKVNYYTLGNNEKPYFTTSASVFMKNKKDYDRCGQCQKDVLPKGSIARNFFEKWDSKHIHCLTDDEYINMIKDLEELKNVYNNIYIEKDTFRNQNSNISFNAIKDLSMMKLK